MRQKKRPEMYPAVNRAKPVRLILVVEPLNKGSHAPGGGLVFHAFGLFDRKVFFRGIALPVIGVGNAEFLGVENGFRDSVFKLRFVVFER